MTSHLRMNAIYWGFTAVCVMGQKDALPRHQMVDYVMSCWDEKAGQVTRLIPALHAPLTRCNGCRRLRSKPRA